MKPAKSKQNSKSSSSVRKKINKKPKGKARVADKQVSTHDVRKLNQELSTYQVELEMQNEELRRSQAELEESRRKYADLYDFAPVAYFTFDKKGLIREVNLTGARLLGYGKREILDKRFSLFILSGDRRVFSAHLSEVFHNQTKNTCELKIRKKDRTVLIVRMESIFFDDNMSNTACVRTAVSDVTQLKIAGEEMTRLASFPQLSPNCILEVNAAGRVVFSNRAAEQVLKEMGQAGKNGLFIPADMDKMLNSLQRRKVLQICREVRIKDRIFEEIIYTTPSFDTARIYANDITWRKESEEALLKANQRLALLSDMAGRLLVTDKPREILDELCKKIMVHLDCHVFFNFLVDEEKGRLRLNAYAGIPDKSAKKIALLDYGVAVCGTVARDGVRVVAEDIPKNPDPKTDLVRSYGIKAYACHPLFSGTKVIGTLSFGSRTKTAFSGDEIDLMKTFASQVSIAMERLQSRIEMEAEVRKRTDALAKALEALQIKMGELKLAKEVLTEQSEQLESFFTHTLTPLVFLDTDFNFIRVNDAYAQACGRDTSEFPGQNHFALYPNKENEAIFKRVVETKTPYQAVAKPFVFPDHPEWGVTYWDWALFPALNNNGDVVFLVFSLQEVTERTLAEQAVYESEKKYHSLIEQASDGIIIFDRQLNFIDANPMASRILGFSREELLSLNAKDLIPADEHHIIPSLLDRVFAGENVREEMSVFGKNGRYVIVEISANMLEGGNIQTIVRDITDRKETEEALMESEARLADAQRLAHLGNWSWDIKTNALHWSDEMYRIFGLSPQKSGITYDGFLHLIHPNDRGYVMNAIQETLQMGKPYNIGYSIILPDGAIRIVHAQGRAAYNEKGEPNRMFGTVQDITKQKRIEEEIRDSREQLRNLYLHLQSVREEERTHIAREIHDEFGTILTALKIDLSWLERQMPEGNTALTEKLRKDLDLINSAIKTVQRISSELRPGILDHLGLGAAMEWHVKEFCGRTGINWDITIDLGDTKPGRDLSTTMFRILQESLTNVARHAEATEVRVSLREKDNALFLDVIDNGKGISEGRLSDRSSFGLIGMRERAQHLGGDVFIQKADGKGTWVLVKIPL